MNFKDDAICNICKRFCDDPISLPCYCFVCNEHILGEEKYIKCLKCDEEFLKTKRLKSNELVKKIINSDLHLTEQQKSIKGKVTKMLSDFDTFLDDFKSNQKNFETNISKHFDDIRNKIDIQKIELKNKIDKIATEMIDQTKEKEKTLLQDLKNANSNIINTGVEKEGGRLIEEFRNPNMNLSNINSSINEHKSKINQIKENINDLINRVNKSKTFCFTPNLCYADKIFGELKLNETITKFISCSNDKTIKIWDLETFECLQTLNGHNDSIWRIENRFNNQILSCSFDKTVKLWNVEAGVCLKTFKHANGVCCIKILSDKTFASGSWKEIKIWNIDDNGRCVKILKGHTSWIYDLVSLPNGSLVSCSSDKKIKLWNIEQGFCTKTLNGHTDLVYCLLILNNGNLASGSKDTTIKIWDLESGNCLTTLFGHNDRVWSLQLKQSGELISASSDETMKIWNLENNTCIKTLNGHNDDIYCLRIFEDNQLLSCSADKTIKLWNLETGNCIQTLTGHTDFIFCLNLA